MTSRLISLGKDCSLKRLSFSLRLKKAAFCLKR